MRRFVFITVMFFVFLMSGDRVFSQRFAACDLCGYCVPQAPSPTILPRNWEACRACLYPGASQDPSAEDTLKVDPANNQPPTPQVGAAYTMIGCISTTGGFTQRGAAASVIQTLLNLLFKASGAIAFLYLIYGSFLILSSQADPERLNHGKSVVYGAIAGLIFSLSSVFLVNLIASGVLKIPGFN